MAFKYILNNFSVFRIKTTIFYICFYILLWLLLLNSVQGRTASGIRINLFMSFSFMQIIITYLLSSVFLFNNIKIGFDKLLYTYKWGIKKIFFNNLLYLILYQIFLSTFAFIFMFVVDSSIISSVFKDDYKIILTFVFNYYVNICLITVIQFIGILLFKSYIGEIIGVILNASVLMLSIVSRMYFRDNIIFASFTDLYGLSFIIKNGYYFLFIVNKIFSLSVIFLILYFILNHYHCFTKGSREKIQVKYNNIYLNKQFFAIINFHYHYIWQQKYFLFLVLLIVIGLFLDITNFSDLISVQDQLLTTLTITQQINSFELFDLIMMTFSVIIPLNLIQSFNRNKFFLIAGSTPISNLTFVFSILFSFLLFSILILFISIVAFTGIAINIYRYDSLYSIVDVFIVFFKNYYIYFFIGCGFILLYLITGKKLLSTFIGVLIYALVMNIHINIKRGILNDNWYLLSYFYLPDLSVSDLNPYFYISELSDYMTFLCFWIFLLSGLFIIFAPLYSRNKEKLRIRITNYKQESDGRKNILFSLIFFILCFICVYMVISKNNNENFDYENRIKNYMGYIEKYKKYNFMEQPEIVNAEFILDIYPELNKFKVKGIYNLKNIDSINIDTLIFTIPLRESAKIKLEKISLNFPHEIQIIDTCSNFVMFSLNKSLKPGDSLILSYELEIKQINRPGFRDMYVDDKWSLIESRYFVITPGYGLYREPSGGRDFIGETDQQIEYFSKRKHLSGNRINPKFKYTISLPENQIIIADGNMGDEIKTLNRKTITYNSFTNMDLFNFSIISSTLYDQITDTVDNYKISVYYSPIHENGAQGILKSAKKLINNYRNIFGELPFHHINIAESPDYRGEGGSTFSNTFVLNESLFTYNFKDSVHINPAIPILAHELAHFWWGGLLQTSFLAGSKALIEGLAEYSALQQLNDFCKEEIYVEYIDFFMARAINNENIPISQIYNDEKNVRSIYYKTPLIFKMLSNNIGEVEFNGMLKSCLKENSGRYVSLSDFLNQLQSSIKTSDSLYINDFFEKNIEYKNKIQNVTINRNSENKYEFNVEFELSKFQIGSDKRLTKINFSDIEKIDISFLKQNKIILQKEIKAQNVNVRVLLSEKPDKIVLDYKRRYMDDDRADNIFEVN